MSKSFWYNTKASADYCKLHFPKSAEHTSVMADEVLGNSFTFCDHWEMERTHRSVTFTGEIDWEYIPDGDPEWLYSFNRHSFLLTLGKAYLYTDNKEYAQRLAGQFVHLLTDWIDRVPLTDESSKTTWRSLDTGLRCEYWIRALDCFEGSPLLTAELIDRVKECLSLHADYLARTSGDFHKLSNWGVLQDHGLFVLGVYLGRQDCIDLAVRRLTDNLRLQVMEDGSHWEQSPMYHCQVLRGFADVITVAESNGVKLDRAYTDKVRLMFAALAKWLTPDGRLICQSDSDDTHAGDVMALGALLFEDGGLKAAAGEELFEENIWDFGVEAVVRYGAITPTHGELAGTVLPDSGNYMLRSGFDADGVFLHMHCGCLGSGHGHADLLHIDLSARGEDILIDSGRYTYVNTPMRRQLKLPAAHNTTMVDGKDFSSCVDSWGYSELAMPIKGEYKLNAIADYISGCHLGYLPIGVFTRRQVVYMKPDIFVVVDSFYTTGEHSYSQSFHLGQGGCKLEGNTLIWQGKRAALKLLALGEGTSLAMEKAPYSKHYNSLAEGDMLRVTKNGAGFTSMVTVLSVSTVDEANEVTARLLPVTTSRLKREIPPYQAQGVQVTKNGREYLLIISHGEVISEVDLLSAAGREGYGKVLVFTPDCPEGICLNW